MAGGKSSRMGEDKGLMSFNGKPMIQYIIDTVSPFVNDIIIIANNNKYLKFGYPVYEDLRKEKGPLAGIYSGLNYSNTNKNIVLSCDTPFVSASLIKLLIEKSNEADVVIPEKDNRTHQLIGIYNRSCVKVFKSELDIDQRKLKLAIKKLTYKVINANEFEDKIFKNINSKYDIEV